MRILVKVHIWIMDIETRAEENFLKLKRRMEV